MHIIATLFYSASRLVVSLLRSGAQKGVLEATKTKAKETTEEFTQQMRTLQREKEVQAARVAALEVKERELTTQNIALTGQVTSHSRDVERLKKELADAEARAVAEIDKEEPEGEAVAVEVSEAHSEAAAPPSKIAAAAQPVTVDIQVVRALDTFSAAANKIKQDIETPVRSSGAVALAGNFKHRLMPGLTDWVSAELAGKRIAVGKPYDYISPLQQATIAHLILWDLINYLSRIVAVESAVLLAGTLSPTNAQLLRLYAGQLAHIKVYFVTILSLLLDIAGNRVKRPEVRDMDRRGLQAFLDTKLTNGVQGFGKLVGAVQ